MEKLDGILLRLGLDNVESSVNDGFGNGFLSVQHDAVHEFGKHPISELGIRQNNPLLGATTT